MIDNLKCRDCPYGIEDFERRMYWYNKIIEERGIPNDIYHDLQPKDVVDEFEQFLWCDKVGGKVYCFGHCTDFYEDIDIVKQKNSSKKKRRNKRERDLKYKNHVKYLAKNYPYYPPPAIPVDEDGCWNFDDPIGTVYYRRTYKGNHKRNRYKYYKKYSNRKVRRYKGEIHRGGSYKKVFNYWWTVD